MFLNCLNDCLKVQNLGILIRTVSIWWSHHYKFMQALEKGIKCIRACGKSYTDVQIHLVHNCKGVSNTTVGF